MTKTISLDEFAAAPQQTMSLEDFHSGDDAIDKGAKAQSSAPLSYVKDLLTQAGDLVLGLPGDAVAKTLNAGVRFRGAFSGESQKLVGQAGEQAEQLVPEGAKAPVSWLRKKFGGEELPPEGMLGTFIHKHAEGIEQATGGWVTQEDAKFALGAGMDLAGMKGLHAAGQRLLRAGAERAKVGGGDTFSRASEQGIPLEDFARSGPPPKALERPIIEGESTRIADEDVPRLTQRGAADPKLLAAIATGGGIAAYVGDDPERAQELAAAGLLIAGGKVLHEGLKEGLSPRSPMAGQEGAIKLKGGMWHPEAAERLARPLADKFHTEDAPFTGPDTRVSPGAVWADIAISRYLNKHAGTATDPLKDVEIPFREEDGAGGIVRYTKRWEDLTDKAFAEHKIINEYITQKPGLFVSQDALPGSKLGESVYAEHPLKGSQERRALQSYLSHVGDYLREHVPADKLPQYDLVRAVKETSAWDKELTKKMDKERADDTGKATLYKDYGDGMKWIQLDKPGQFARESDAMGHSVRGYEPPRRVDNYDEVVNQVTRGGPHPDWVEASGDSGHSSYGLGGWEAIKRGDAKVYSLRDAKGKSLATVEVHDHKNAAGNRGIVNNSLAEITQIKGPQNRAPSPSALPYIQDFVKSGKWGEVGDAHNAGLTRSIQPDGNVKFLTAEELDNKLGRQRGSIDPKLLAAIAGIGGSAALGAYFGGDLRSAVFGGLAAALVGTGKGRAILKSPLQGIEHITGLVSTRLGNISQPLLRRAQEMERRTLQQTDKAMDAVHPFIEGLGKLPKAEQEIVARGLLNGDFTSIPQHLRAPFARVQGLLSGLEGELRGLGRFAEGVTNYFPRLVKDLEGLKSALGQKMKTGIERVLAEAEAKSIREKGRGLSEVEQSIIVNRFIHAPAQASFLPGYARGRRVGEVTSKLQKFYVDPRESLLRYVSGAISDVQTAKFFGRDLAARAKGSKEFTDVDDSIGNLVQRETRAGKLKPEQVGELTQLLRSRFVGGEKAMAGPLQDVRNLSNLGLLGNFWSAATQIGDSLMTVYHHGLVPTLKGVVQKVGGNSEVTPKQLGLVNHVAEELSGQRWSGKALQVGLKGSMFAAIDRFAKGLNINAALAKARRQAGSEGGMRELARKWEPFFGEEFPLLVEDLRVGRVTDRVESLLFGEISKAQPITKLEVPQAYLDHPNGRLLYQMKTYMLKQADIVRRDAYQEIKDGLARKQPRRIMTGLKNLTALATIYAISNVPGDAVKSWLSGQDFEITGPGLVENLLQNFGFNRYATEKLKQGKIVETVQGVATPPVQMFVDIAQGTEKALKYLPFVGRGIYDRFFGGNERKEIAEHQQKITKERKEKQLLPGERLVDPDTPALSDKAKAFRKEQKEKRKAELAEKYGRQISDDFKGSFAERMASREWELEQKNDKRRELIKEAYKRWGKRGVRNFQAEEEQSELRKGLLRNITRRSW